MLWIAETLASWHCSTYPRLLIRSTMRYFCVVLVCRMVLADPSTNGLFHILAAVLNSSAAENPPRTLHQCCMEFHRDRFLGRSFFFSIRPISFESSRAMDCFHISMPTICKFMVSACRHLPRRFRAARPSESPKLRCGCSLSGCNSILVNSGHVVLLGSQTTPDLVNSVHGRSHHTAAPLTPLAARS